MTKLTVASLLIFSFCGISTVRAQTPRNRRPQTATKQAAQQTNSAHKAPTSRAYSVDDVIWWLPEDTQTLSVVRGPYKTTPPISELPERISAIEQVALVLRMAPFGSFQMINEGSFYKLLVGRTVLFGVEASRKFRAPEDLGGMLYEGCDIVVFQEGLGPARDELLKQMASQAKQVQTIAGQEVMSFEETLEHDLWEFFICIPSPDVLLCATNKDFLAQVLTRMHKRGQTRALPDNLREWKLVDTTARFWALRHYDKADAIEDPSSPLSGEQSAANWPDTKAVGIVFAFDPASSKVATVKYLSDNKDALKLFSDEHLKIGQGFNPVIRQTTDGVVEMKVSLTDDEGSSMFLMVLFALLGHAVFV